MTRHTATDTVVKKIKTIMQKHNDSIQERMTPNPTSMPTMRAGVNPKVLQERAMLLTQLSWAKEDGNTELEQAILKRLNSLGLDPNDLPLVMVNGAGVDSLTNLSLTASTDVTWHDAFGISMPRAGKKAIDIGLNTFHRVEALDKSLHSQESVELVINDKQRGMRYDMRAYVVRIYRDKAHDYHNYSLASAGDIFKTQLTV